MTETQAGDGAAGQPAEHIIARLRPRARGLIVPAIIVIAVCGVTGYLYGTLDEAWLNLLVLAGAAFVVLVFGLLPLLAWLSRRCTITSRRIILRRGLLVRVRQELLHSRGYDVTVRRTAVQSLFGSGDVLINAGLDTPVVLRDVPKPNLVLAALHDLMEANQNQIAAARQQRDADSDRTVVWGSR